MDEKFYKLKSPWNIFLSGSSLYEHIPTTKMVFSLRYTLYRMYCNGLAKGADISLILLQQNITKNRNL